MALPVTAGGGAGGDGKAVSITNTAAIFTTGVGAHGIVAQSIAGGGGLVGGGQFATALGSGSFAGSAGGAGSAGSVTLTNGANVIVTGLDSTAIFAQSAQAGGLGNDINITNAAGVLLSGGIGTGHAVWFDGGKNNALNNAGVMTTSLAIDGFTLQGGAGNETINNTGWTIGSVNLGLGLNPFNNKITGIFDAGTTVFLNDGSTLTNEGLFSPGAFLRVLTTNVTGNETQLDSGRYGLDLSYLLTKNGDPQPSDRTNITGTGVFDGVVDLNIMRPGLAKTGSHDTTIVHTGGGVTNAGLEINAVPTAVATYTLVYPNPDDIVLNYVIDFSPKGLTTNQHSVGNAINRIQNDLTSPNFEPIAAALYYQPTVAALGRVYDSMSGEGTSGVQQTAFSTNDMFMTTVLRQATLNPFEDDANSVRGGSTLSYAGAAEHPAFAAFKAPRYEPPRWRSWAQGYGAGASVNGEMPLGTAQLKFSTGGLAVGTHYRPDPDTLIGIAAGGDFSQFSVSERSTYGSVAGGHVAAYGATRWNALYAKGVVGFDFFENHESRTVSIPGTNQPIVPVPGFFENLHGQFGSKSFSARFEAGWRAYSGFVNVTPFVAVQYGLLHLNGYGEAASGGPSIVGLTYASRYVDSLPAFVGTEFEQKFAISGDRLLSSWLRVAWMHEFEPYRTINPTFIAAPGYDFIIDGAVAPRDAARVSTGVKVELDKNVLVFTNFDGEFSNKSYWYAGSGGFKVIW